MIIFWKIIEVEKKCARVPPPPPPHQLFQDLRDFLGWRRSCEAFYPTPLSKHPGAAPGYMYLKGKLILV